ncbi:MULTISPECIES: ABC transporter substrate-binding protein [unclassified Amycolatopsis]|uniref:ABC transporter substrate-binding protein n=1 Tax=unclassified Amycolatopsis TaxID=2618356 RepID=UPI002876326C|nr:MULTISPECIES: ABC transporter substrate-binding protein [unclassified Amycolatopsis]MDS0135838.1 ABC transporter substrate-binding protein [Amycolatopsis sp. 505]MDS0145561.1 ABC transporter substrate-binding protein [Amycolatopsis sp. CM201R]
MRTARILGTALVLAAVAACSPSQATTGGTLSIATQADPTCLDPQQTGQLVSMDVSRSLVDTLTDQDPKTGKIVPWLAEQFTALDGGRKFKFVLRQGVTFSDGTPVDSAAVKATFDQLVKLPANGAPAYIRGYTGTTVIDPRTFTVDFTTPNAQFLQATSGAGLGILSTATAKKPLAARCRGDYVGSGPYVLDHYTANQEVVIKKRPDYAWPSSLSANRGAAALEQIRFAFVPEDGARTTALRSGQVQLATAIQPTDQDLFQGNGFSLLSASSPGAVNPLSLNHKGILADERVRKALLTGIDREELVKAVLGSRAKPATSVLSSSTPFYQPTDKLRYDPQASGRLLSEAGWAPGSDGIRVKDGQRLSLNWLIPAPMPPANEAVQQQLRKIGVELKLNAVPPAKYVEQQSAGNFDLTAVAVTRADPDVLRNLFYSKGQNLWHLPPSRLDSYLEQQLTAGSDAERQQAVTNAVHWIIDHADSIPLYENALVDGVSDQVKDLTLDASLRLRLHDARLG